MKEEDPPLTPEREGLVRLSAALATGSEERIRAALEGVRESAPPEAVEEILLQSYLFLGFPAALGALALWREVSGRPAGDGTRGAHTAESEAAALTRRIEKGEEVCRIVYGSQYHALRQNIRALHPAMERWMIEEGYGKVLGREGLELAVRELAIAALLAVLGARVQLHSHLRGALNAGADEAMVGASMALAGEYLTEEERRAVGATWARVRETR